MADDIEIVGINTPKHGFKNEQMILIVINTQNAQGTTPAHTPIIVDRILYSTRHSIDPVPLVFTSTMTLHTNPFPAKWGRNLNRGRAIS
jgi:hypothetical protein